MSKCIIIFILTLLPYYSQAQLLLDDNYSVVDDSLLLKDIKQRTLPEIAKLLQKDIESMRKIENLFKMMGNNALEDKVFKKNEIENEPPFTLGKVSEIAQKFNTTVNATLLFKQHISATPSIDIYPDRGDKFMSEFADPEYKILQYWHNMAVYDITKIGLRKVDSVKALASLKFPTKQTIVKMNLANKTLKIRNGFIQIDSVRKAKVYITMSTNLHDQLLETQAITSNKLIVGSYESSFRTNDTLDLAAIITWMKTLQTRIEAKKILSADNFIAVLQQEKVHLKPLQQAPTTYKMHYAFKANNVQELVFYFADAYQTLQKDVKAKNVDSVNTAYYNYTNEAGLTGICNYNGDIIVPAEYNRLEKAGNYYYSNADTSYYLLNVAEKKLQPIVTKNIELHEENGITIATKKWTAERMKVYHKTGEDNGVDSSGVLDDKGNVIVPLKYAVVNGYNNFIACKDKRNDKEYKLFDAQGSIIKNAIYEDISAITGFRQSLANAYIVEHNNKVGIINANATVMVPLVYDYIKYMQHGLAIFGKDEKCGAFDTNFNIAIPAIYNWLDVLDANTVVYNKTTNGDRKFGLIDNKNNILVTAVYDDLKASKADNLYWAEQRSGYGAINRKGETIIPFNLANTNDFCEGYAFVFTKTDYGIIDTKGKFVMRAPKPDSYSYSSSGTGNQTIYKINKKKYNYKGIIIPN